MATTQASKSAAQAALDRAVTEAEKDAALVALKEATNAANKAFLEGASKFVNPSRLTKVGAFFRKWPKLTGGVVGIAVTIGVQVFLDFIWGKINKDFFLSVEIYNFDKKAWKVNDWHHDNGIIAGGGDFEAQSLAAVTTADQFPWGQPVQGWPLATGVTYAFQNSYTVLDGVGIALRAVSEEETGVGFALGYIIKSLADNRLALQPGVPSSIGQCYFITIGE
ncbi:hypothetical protein LZ30DRAFT_783576 [Colletotrichum cereale]|nr:hypothetical protein LZ30DRAFT_783576 [Colletotrichum cereale]